MDKKIIIIGAFKETIELIEDNDYKILGFFDKVKTGECYGYKVFGTDEIAEKIFPELKNIPILIIPDQPERREKLANIYSEIGYKTTSLISKNAQVARSASVGEGSIVQSLVNISTECQIGKYVKINTLANVMHNTIIGDFTTIAPNAVLLGNVKVGKSCYIGSNATILSNIEIGDGVIIGAGSVVTKSIKTRGVYAGNPAKFLKK